jgi:hypothetical protein
LPYCIDGDMTSSLVTDTVRDTMRPVRQKEMAADVEMAVAKYVHFYNFQRINLKNGLTPDEIRSKSV